MAADAGTTVSIRKGEKTRFESTDAESYLALPTWAATTKYQAGEVVVTTASTGDEYDTWECQIDHTSAATEQTASTNTEPSTLDNDKWSKQREDDLVYSVSDVTIDYPVTSTTTKNLSDKIATVTQTNGAPTIAMNLNDAADVLPLERMLGRGEVRVFIEIKRGCPAAGEKGIRYRGFTKLGASNLSFPGGEDGIITKTLNFTADPTGDTPPGNLQFYEETYVAS